MDFNISKCKILQIITHHNKSVFTNQMLNTPLKTVLQHNYLGIVSTTNYRGNHTSATFAIKRIDFWGLKRNLYNAPLEIEEQVYKQLLLPSIEHCSAIWDPYHQTSINKLEMIQHRATRFVLMAKI